MIHSQLMGQTHIPCSIDEFKYPLCVGLAAM